MFLPAPFSAASGPVSRIDRDLVEWDYGEYGGRLTADILAERPDWQLFREGCPGGESPRQVGARADRVVNRLRAMVGNALLFSSGHFLRVLATRWLGIEPQEPQIPHLEYGEPQRTELRKRPLPAGGPALERRPSRARFKRAGTLCRSPT